MRSCQRKGCERVGTSFPTLNLWLSDYVGPPAQITMVELPICSEHRELTTVDELAAKGLGWAQIESRLGFSVDRARTTVTWTSAQ